MIIYPAIDILDGKCVRLQKGNYDKVTVYSDIPSEFAKEWELKGANYLHLVDLNGARSGKPINDTIIKEIAKCINIPIQTGGGIRNMKRIEQLLECGVTRVILGTAAVRNPEFVKEALNEYKEKIVIGIDAKDSYVAINGWEEKSEFRACDFALKMQELGAKTIIYTDIARDGMLVGPNIKAMIEMCEATKMDIIASGGVGSKKDIEDLGKTKVSGVIVGKALYENRVDLEEIVNVY